MKKPKKLNTAQLKKVSSSKGIQADTSGYVLVYVSPAKKGKINASGYIQGVKVLECSASDLAGPRPSPVPQSFTMPVPQGAWWRLITNGAGKVVAHWVPN